MEAASTSTTSPTMHQDPGLQGGPGALWDFCRISLDMFSNCTTHNASGGSYLLSKGAGQTHLFTAGATPGLLIHSQPTLLQTDPFMNLKTTSAAANQEDFYFELLALCDFLRRNRLTYVRSIID